MRKLIENRAKIVPILEVVKFFLILVLLLMFISFNKQAAEQAASTKAIAESTNKVVKGQGDILAAIKQVTDDTRITAVQQTAIIICMLQVPIDSRTTDLQTQCRDQATAADADSGVGTGRSSTENSSASSSQNTPAPTPSQSNSSQSDNFSPTTPEPAQSTGILDLVLNPIKNLVNGL